MIMSISAKLLSMHSSFGLIILMATFVVLTMVGFLIARRFMPANLLPSHNNIVGYIFSTLSVIYAVLLGFAIFMVWQQYENTETSAALEAEESLALYRDLSLYPSPESTAPIIETLVLYVRSVIDEEYPMMMRKQRSKTTDDAFRDLWTRFGVLDPRESREQILYSQILTDMHNMARSRTNRLQAAEDELPDMIWLTLIFGAIVTVGCTFFFCPDHVKAHLLLTCLLAAVLASVWFVIMGLDHPFLGWASIKSGYFQRALEVIMERRCILTLP